jgi:hypothetical protein
MEERLRGNRLGPRTTTGPQWTPRGTTYNSTTFVRRGLVCE